MILMLSLKEREIPKRTSISCPHLLTCNSNNIQSNPRKSRIGKIIPDVSVWKVPAFVAITLSSGVASLDIMCHKFTWYVVRFSLCEKAL